MDETFDIDMHAWHRDGHTIDLFMDVFVGPPRGDGTRSKDGQLRGRITCPPDSVCHRWFAAHPETVKRCFLQMELDAVGLYDLLDGSMESAELPEDWSSEFPITVEWRDEGEDGVFWRPVVASTEEEGNDGHTDGEAVQAGSEGERGHRLDSDQPAGDGG